MPQPSIRCPADPRWTTTLPHLIRPQPDEALVGFVLRCDTANGWPAGSTAALLWPHYAPSSSFQGNRLARLASPPPAAIQALATLTDLPMSAVEALTWPIDLHRGGIGPFAVCATCVQEAWLIRRDHVRQPWVGSLVRARCTAVGYGTGATAACNSAPSARSAARSTAPIAATPGAGSPP